MGSFHSICCSAAAGAVSTTCRRYCRSPDSIQLPSWVHTKELTIWGYAA
jgi:hypothetical protein